MKICIESTNGVCAETMEGKGALFWAQGLKKGNKMKAHSLKHIVVT